MIDPRIIELPDTAAGEDPERDAASAPSCTRRPNTADGDDSESDDVGRCFGSVKPWAGNMMPPSHFNPNTCDFAAPQYELQMDHVYGFRARGTRDCVHWVDEPSTFIYIAASVAVVYNWVERRQKFFKGHSDDISSATFHRGTRLAATGGLGKQNTAPICIWSVDTMQTVHELKGTLMFDIASVAFNVDASRIVGVGADNFCSVAVYDVRSGVLLSTSRGDSNRILHAMYNTAQGGDGRKSFITIGVSHVKFWSKNKDQIVGKKAIGGDIAKQTSVSVCCTSKYVVVGNVSGSGYVFSDGTLVATLKLHTDFCGALACENDVLYSGGRDGFIRRWALEESVGKRGKTCVEATEQHKWELNSQHPLSASKTSSAGRSFRNGPRALSVSNGRLVFGTNIGGLFVAPSDFEVQIVLNSHFEDKPGSQPELWGMSIHPTEPLFASVSDDATLRLWSVELGSMILLADIHYAARCCAISMDGGSICVGHSNGAFSVWDSTTLTPIVPFTRKREFVSQCCAYSPDGRFLAIGMGLSHVVDIYDVKRGYNFIASCDALSGNIRQLDWSESSTMLRCATASYEVVHFNVPSCEMNQSLDVADETWASQTCIIGWGVQGIWEGCSDGTDVNCVGRSRCGTLLAAGYDMCTVRLYNYPCLPRQSDRSSKFQFPGHREYIGHSSHVTNCGFTADNRYVLSSGGMDQTIIRWRVVPIQAQSHAPRAGDDEHATSDEDAEPPATAAAAVAEGVIRELPAEERLRPAQELSQSHRRLKLFGGSSSQRTTFRRPGTGNSGVRSRLYETTASASEKARVAMAQRRNVDQHRTDQPRFGV